MWIMTTVIVVFYGVDIGAFVGWIPASYSNENDTPLAVTGANQDIKLHTTQANVMGNNSNRTMCAECGVIVLIREIHEDGADSDLGIVSRNVLGNEIEKKMGSAKRYEIKIRFDDGSSRVYSTGNPPALRSGNQIKVVDGVIRLNSHRAREGVKHRSRRSAVAAASVWQFFGNEGTFRRAIVKYTA